VQFVKGDHEKLKRRGKWFAWLAIAFFFCCFIFIPLGAFIIWIFIGGTVYCTFFSIYSFVIAHKARYPYRKKPKETPQEKETRAYIQQHLPIVISLLLGGLLIALTIWLFFT
jgi:hypothetical protein